MHQLQKPMDPSALTLTYMLQPVVPNCNAMYYRLTIEHATQPTTLLIYLQSIVTPTS